MDELQKQPGLPRIQGRLRKDTVTKRLVVALGTGEIAAICHRDLDETAAAALIEAGVRAVVNAAETMTGSLPTLGAKRLLDARIPIFEMDPAHFALLENRQEVVIEQRGIRTDTGQLIPVKPLTHEQWQQRYDEAVTQYNRLWNHFVDNTVRHVDAEKRRFAEQLAMPPIKTSFAGRHALIVVRGCGHRQDLAALGRYIRRNQPVLVGVDGGADVLLKQGYMPDLIIGDMDSVSDAALRCGAELVVHAYCDGRAPGAARISRMGQPPVLFPSPGTSEDAAMLLAFEQRAERIVLVGGHTHMIEFLEKGRAGMASTLLTRLKLGATLIDAKGYALLQEEPPAFSRALPLTARWSVACVFVVGMLLGFMMHESDNAAISLMKPGSSQQNERPAAEADSETQADSIIGARPDRAPADSYISR